MSVKRQTETVTAGMLEDGIRRRTDRAVAGTLRAMAAAEGELLPLHSTVQNVTAMAAIRLQAALNNVPAPNRLSPSFATCSDHALFSWPACP